MVLGVPSNDFGEQEPGDEASILAFCTERYAVDFPMTAKQKVIGGAAHPLYRWIEEEFGEAATPRWNFHKYLLDGDGDGDGELIGMRSAEVEPLADELIESVEAALPGPE